jgi:hypothetical protein
VTRDVIKSSKKCFHAAALVKQKCEKFNEKLGEEE